MLRFIIASLLTLALASPAFGQEQQPVPPGSQTGPEDAIPVDLDDLSFDEDDDLYQRRRSEPATVDKEEKRDEADDGLTNDDFEDDIQKNLGIEEITVTSQRRRSTLQDVPVSVTAFTASEIEAQGIQDIKGISDYTPNLEIKVAFAASNPTLYIRGVGLNDYNANAASSVAVYQDDVYMNFPAGQLFQFFDVGGVEVLRGPQGSLYGRNASAGAIRVFSNEPSEEFELTGTVTYGRFNEFELESAVGGPLVDGLVSGRMAFHYRRRDGFRKNLCVFDEPTPPGECGIAPGSIFSDRGTLIPPNLPRRLNDVNNWAGRALIRVTPDWLESNWLFNVHGGQNDSQTTSLFLAAGRLNIPKNPPDGVFETDVDYPHFPEYTNEDPYAGHYNRVGFEKLDTMGTSAKGLMHFGEDVRLFSLTAFERADRAVTDDFDSTPLTLSHNDYNDTSWQVSQDMRVDWAAGDNVDLTFGGTVLAGDLAIDNIFGTPGNRAEGFDLPGDQFLQEIQQENVTFAFYGHFRWTFLDDFELEGGLRYNWERKSFDVSSVFVPNPVACAANSDRLGCDSSNPMPHLIYPPARDGVQVQLAESWSAPTGDISLSYRLTEETRVYAKYSRGWKPGGFNGAVTSPGAGCTELSCPIVEPIRAETVDGWETGIKSYWFDRRLMVNAALFVQKYEDLQVFVVENTNLTGTPLPKLINANDAQIYGMELELWGRPIVGLEIRSQFGWLESEYLDFTRNYFRSRRVPGRPATVQQVQSDFTGNRLTNNPRYSWSGTTSYEIALGERNGYLRPGFAWSFSSVTYFDPTEGKGRNNQGTYRDRWAGNTFLGQPAYWLLNASLSYVTPDERLEITAWVRNLADTAYSVEAFSSLEDNRSVQRVIGEPRTFGITMWLTY